MICKALSSIRVGTRIQNGVHNSPGKWETRKPNRRPSLCIRATQFLHCATPYWVNESSLRPCTPWKRCASKDQIPEGKLGGGLKLMYKHGVHGLGLRFGARVWEMFRSL